MHCRPWTALLVVVVTLLAAAVTTAGAPPDGAAPPRRPRVGLVLSGGGALGIAHVGVLKVLEELHVPVDCVAGTSMGAIVGGLYASGYSPAELETLALELDWRDLMDDRPERRQLPFRRKVDDLTYLSPYEVGFSGGRLLMPSGLVLGHKLGVELKIRTLRSAGVTRFDDLPLPFRAVATDIGTGSMVILDRGSLADALRASMAIPGVFAPATLDGRVLVDGGLVRFLPVDVARAIGAEVVIGVDLAQPVSPEIPADTLAGVMTRSMSMLTLVNAERALPGVDILVRPEVADIGALDFGRAAEILPRGEVAARARLDALRALAVGDEEWQAYLARQRRGESPMTVGDVTVESGTDGSSRLLARLVESQPGQQLDAATVRADVARVWELGEFEAVDLTLTPRDGVFDLRLRARPKSWGPNLVRFGVSVFADLEGTAELNVLADFTMTRLDRYGGEFKTAVQMGVTPRISTEFYQPLSADRTWFVAVSAQGSQTKAQVPVEKGSVQYRFRTATGELGFGVQLGRWGELRLAVRRESVDGQPNPGQGGDAPNVSRTDAGFVFRGTLDQLDSTSFPKRGFLISTELLEARTGMGADVEYHKLSVDAFTVGTRGRHTAMLQFRGGSALGGSLPPGQRFSLGGLFSLSGLPPGEITGSYGGVASLIYTFRPGKKPVFGKGLYLGFSAEAGDLWETHREVGIEDLHYSSSAFVGADTALGPVYLAYGISEGGKDSFYLYLGRTF